MYMHSVGPNKCIYMNSSVLEYSFMEIEILPMLRAADMV